MIRKATTADIDAIRDIALVTFPHTYRDMLSPGQLEYMMDWMYSPESLLSQMSENGHVYYISPGEGYVSVRPDGMTDDGRDRYHLEKIYVMPSLQGTGLGRRLFDTAVEHVLALSPNHPRIELNVNRNNGAVSFYEHLGMHCDRSGDFPIGGGYYMNDHIMAIDL